MKLTNVIITLLAWLTFAAAAPTTNLTTALVPTLNPDHLPSDDSTVCSDKNQALTNAIGIFCANPRPNIQAEGTFRVMSGEDWTLEDIQWGIQVAWVCGDVPGEGDGVGSPAGDITDDVCFSTWWSMCATGDQYGGGITTHQGEQDCQEWSKC